MPKEYLERLRRLNWTWTAIPDVFIEQGLRKFTGVKYAIVLTVLKESIDPKTGQMTPVHISTEKFKDAANVRSSTGVSNELRALIDDDKIVREIGTKGKSAKYEVMLERFLDLV